mmetsp:Transcript_27257/g.43854  ORF Transcript_27257/g.43854 Transcript_27257/m.43854 type:complete len:639 (+) Transcript_27257:213-2129(+)
MAWKFSEYGTIAFGRKAGRKASDMWGDKRARQAITKVVVVMTAICLLLSIVYHNHRDDPAQAPSEAIVAFNESHIYRAGALFSEMQCRLDNRVTAENIDSYRDNLGQIWGSSCGLNRGIFTLADYPGHTFNCGQLPQDWSCPNGVADLFTPGRDVERDLGYLSTYIGGVFNTTAGIGPSSCSFNGMAHLWCGASRVDPWKKTPWVGLLGDNPIRGVNVGGLFVLEPWINKGFTTWNDDIRDQYTYCKAGAGNTSLSNSLKKHWDSFYTEKDFELMASYGINTARVPVGWWYFAAAAQQDPAPYITPDEDILTDMNHPITRVISFAAKHGIHVILDLHGAPGSQNGLDNSGIRSMDPVPERWGDGWFYSDEDQERTIEILQVMTKYINMLSSKGVDNILMLELMNEPWVFGDMSIVRDFYVKAIPMVRQINGTLPILVCDAFRHEEWHWLLRRKGFDFRNVYMDTHLYHAFNPSDVASDNPHDDMMKQIIHNDMACGYGSLLRYKTCSSLPTMTGEWSLAIDDCMGFLTGSTSSANQFQDFGQCKNIAKRSNDNQWKELVTDFAKRQRSVFEKELGWVFWAWKVDGSASKDISAKYWSYSMAVDEGFFPRDLNKETGLRTACDHPVDMSDIILPAPTSP